MAWKQAVRTGLVASSALLVATAIGPACAAAAEQTVVQKGKAFSVRKLKVKVGDTVRFVNDDPFSHNIFSVSPALSFDSGAFPQGASKRVTFDKAGTVDVECAIHPDMRMSIEVEN